MKWYDFLLYGILFPFTCISYILTPLTNDMRIYIGTEYIADTFYRFPYGIDIAWEIKPISNRIINWVFYKTASIVVPIDNDILFGIGSGKISVSDRISLR